MGHKHVFPFGEPDLSHPFATAGLLSVLDDGYGILTAEYAPTALARSHHLWNNLAFKRAIIACVWPVAGQAGSPPAWMLSDGVAWTKAVYTTEILALLQAAKVM